MNLLVNLFSAAYVPYSGIDPLYQYDYWALWIDNEYFKDLDLNNDGYLTLEEMKEYKKKWNQTYLKEEENFSDYDVNKSGKVFMADYAEYQVLIRTYSAAAQEMTPVTLEPQTEKAFLILDTNFDGVLSVQELLKTENSQHRAEFDMQLFSRDGNDTMTLREFADSVQYVTGLPLIIKDTKLE